MPDTDDLWGADFRPNPVESPPITLLKKQADLLTSRTEGHVEGIVKEDIAQDGTVWTSLYARVPALGAYEHKLVTIAHPVSIADQHFPSPLTVVNTEEGSEIKINNMHEFRKWLSRTLSSPEIHTIIENLMRYARSAKTQSQTAVS